MARHGEVADFGSCESSRADGSFLTCSIRSRATSLRRRPPDANAKRRIARSRVSAERSVAGCDQPIEDIPLALALARPWRSSNEQTQRRAKTRRRERPLDPFPTVQCAPTRQAPPDGVWGMGTLRAQRALRPQVLGNVRGHPPMLVIARALGGPRDDAPHISTPAPRSPAMAGAGRRRRPPRLPDGRDPTRAPAGYSRLRLRARDASRFRRRRP
jgi:hypothetical protein